MLALLDNTSLSAGDVRLAQLAAVYLSRSSIFHRPGERGFVVEDEALDLTNLNDCPTLFCEIRKVEEGDLGITMLREGHTAIAVSVEAANNRQFPPILHRALVEGLEILRRYRLHIVVVERVAPGELSGLISHAAARAASPIVWSRQELSDGKQWNWAGYLPNTEADARALPQLVWLEPRGEADADDCAELYSAELAAKELAALRASIATPTLITDGDSIWLHTDGGRDDKLAAPLEASPLYARWSRERGAWQIPYDQLGYLMTLLASNGQSPLIIQRSQVTNAHIAALLDGGGLDPLRYIGHALRTEDLASAAAYRVANPEISSVVEFARRLILLVLTDTLSRDEAVARFEEQAANYSGAEFILLYGICGPDIVQAADR